MEKVPGLPEYEDLLEDQCKFLLRVLGRGLFLIFQGSLWLGFASLSEIFDLAVGGYLVFIGVLYVMMHYGVLPKACVEVTRSSLSSAMKAAKGHYQQVGAPPPSAA